MSALISIITRENVHADTIRWALREMKAGPVGEVDIDIVRSFMPIDANRNLQVERFLASEHSHIFFLDSDAVPPRSALWVLLDADKDVILAPNLIFDHGPRHVEYMVYDDPWPEEGRISVHNPTAGVEKIHGSGMSGLLVHRKVLEKLPPPWFRFTYGDDGKILIGEDVMFYRNVRDAGFDVWCDYSLVQQHYKTLDLKEVFDAAKKTEVGFHG